MAIFPRSPRTLRGAIVSVDPFNPVAGAVLFQYNPETLQRTLTPRFVGQEGGARGTVRFAGPPIEHIQLTVELDATDQLERGAGRATELGIYPQLSALEMIVYPKSSAVVANQVLARLGTLEVIQPEAPLTLLIWGVKRVIPVRLTSFGINEQAYDVNLNPIRARVALGMQVLTYNDLPAAHAGTSVFLAHQVAKESMAALGLSTALADAGVPLRRSRL